MTEYAILSIPQSQTDISCMNDECLAHYAFRLDVKDGDAAPDFGRPCVEVGEGMTEKEIGRGIRNILKSRKGLYWKGKVLTGYDAF